METIIAAAIKTGPVNVALVLRPGRHKDVAEHLVKKGMKEPAEESKGFVTSEGRFVDRVEGKQIAYEAQQIITREGLERDELHSEDLW